MKLDIPPTPITPREDGTPDQQLAFFENKIFAACQLERDIGRALYEIKTRKLFKIYGTNFSDYCQGRFDIKKSRIYQLIRFEKACAAATAAGQPPPANERVYRDAAARRDGKGSRPAELARLQKILVTAILAQPPEERVNLLQDLQLFLGRFAKDMAANLTLPPPPPAAPTPTAALQNPTLEASANSTPTNNTDERMTATTKAGLRSTTKHGSGSAVQISPIKQ